MPVQWDRYHCMLVDLNDSLRTFTFWNKDSERLGSQEWLVSN